MKSKNLVDSKLPIGVVIAIVLQTAGLVYYVGKQANQFETMKETVSRQEKQLDNMFARVQQHDIELEKAMKKLKEDRIKLIEKALVVASPAPPPPENTVVPVKQPVEEKTKKD